MAVNRYNKQFKQRDDVLGSVTPNPILNAEVKASVGDFRPAAWLPVLFTKTDSVAGTDAFVIAKGKVVALDADGKVVPAGLRVHFEAQGSLVYTAVDASYGVIDLVTGLTVTGAVTYTVLEVARALVEQGKILLSDCVSGVIPASAANAATAMRNFISPPVGIAAYDYYVWAGRPEEDDVVFLNYTKQSSVAFMTEATMIVPHLAVDVASDSFAVATLNTAGTAVAATGDQILPGEYWDATNLTALTKYSLLGITASSPVVALGLDPEGDGTTRAVAKNTDRTPVSCSIATVLLKEKASPADISAAGDWYLDEAVGAIFVHSTTWSTGVSGTETWVFSYSAYVDATLATSEQVVSITGRVLPGARVSLDSKSNLLLDSAAGEDDVVGRIHKVIRFPKGYLEAVKTGFPSSTAATSRMPGSATKGYPDAITLNDGIAADQMVVVNIKI